MPALLEPMPTMAMRIGMAKPRSVRSGPATVIAGASLYQGGSGAGAAGGPAYAGSAYGGPGGGGPAYQPAPGAGGG